MIRINEHDEFLLNRLLDGDLSEAEAASLRARVGREQPLQEAWDALQRLDASLAEQHRDVPDVDFGAFRAQVMQSVRSEARERQAPIRFPVWLRFATPIAAAAAVALIVTVYRPDAMPTPGSDTGPGAVALVQADPEPPTSGAVVVQFRRSAGTQVASAASSARIRVNFARSDQIATTVAESDEAQRSNPTIVMAAPVPAPRPMVTGGTLHLPPL